MVESTLEQILLSICYVNAFFVTSVSQVPHCRLQNVVVLYQGAVAGRSVHL